MKKPYPWPLDLMRRWYEEEGLTLEELSRRLSSDLAQFYWRRRLGKCYRPNPKIVNKVCKRAGFAMRPTGAKGERNGSWNGGQTVDKCGYVLVRRPEHPHANRCGYVREHRLAMEEKIGRILKPGEVVHHKDKDKANNDPDNLELYDSNGEHLKDELTGQRPNWSPEGYARICSPRGKAKPGDRRLRSAV